MVNRVYMEGVLGKGGMGAISRTGTTWERSPLAVNDHDFRSQADGIAIPYGIYDLTANRGFVVVGTSHDTPDFAADNLLRWWQAEGLQHYPRARELLVLADPAAATLRAFAASSMPCRHASSTRIASRSPSVTTPAAPPSGIRSIIACSVRSARTGPVCH